MTDARPQIRPEQAGCRGQAGRREQEIRREQDDFRRILLSPADLLFSGDQLAGNAATGAG